VSPDELIARHLDGLASEEERAELDRLLASSPEAAAAFARASRLDHALHARLHEERNAARVRRSIRPARRWGWAAAAAALLAIAVHGLLPGSPAALADGRPLRAGDVVRGPAAITFPGEATKVDLAEGAEAVLGDAADGKRLELRAGRLRAVVAPQPRPFVVRTAQAEARVLGTRFTLAAGKETRLEVEEGRVRLVRASDAASVEVSAGQAAASTKLAAAPLYETRFLELWRELHDPANGYFSPDGVPYHSVETLIVDAPDYGHLSTSETFSYWIWLEAAYGRLTGDWSWLARAWKKTEEILIPSAADQPTSGAYNPAKPATATTSPPKPEDYPARLADAVRNADTLADELRRTHGTSDLYLMHWLVDADDWYGFGRRGEKGRRNALLNTFQRGPHESVWETVPHPSWEDFSSGGPNGYLDLFLKEEKPAKQWRYVAAPDADARAVQALGWAARWAREQGRDPASVVPVKEAARMGDALRYALRSKRFGSVHHLIGWSVGWGGSIGPANAWGWRAGSDDVHIGYQNPAAAWFLAEAGSAEWRASVEKQIDLYRWVQSAEGAFGGGARVVDGKLVFAAHPVFLDPPSHEWFGWQAWAAERLGQYAALSEDARARPLLARWAAWAKPQVRLSDAGFEVPATLSWRGAPGDLHVSVASWNRDVGVAAATARALAWAGETAFARELLDRLWASARDAKGLSLPETRADYARFHDRVAVPDGWSGRTPQGAELRPGATFLELRPKYRQDPAFPSLSRSPTFRYHRFWAQVEAALACAELSK
jgi:ferric-dicitrate binding protein FerR (iron transport regulator)